jgi:L-arabinonolactonase
MNYQVEHMLSVHNEIGEAPLWVPEERRLYWTDTEASMVWSYQPGNGARESWTLSLPVTAIMRRERGGFLLVTKTGLAFWDRDTNTCEPLANPLRGSKSLRFNDGAVDRQGRLVAGTMNCRILASADGCLYRLDPDRRVTRLDGGLAVANGICFSPDGARMYVSEQFRGRILQYEYDCQTGQVSGKRVFAELPEAEGKPDGLVVDSEGFLWNAHWGGGLITRYSPDGVVAARIRLPVPVVTCMAFAGERLNELYVTTGWYGMNLAEQKKTPGCGDLFRVRTDRAGLVEPRFLG